MSDRGHLSKPSKWNLGIWLLLTVAIVIALMIRNPLVQEQPVDVDETYSYTNNLYQIRPLGVDYHLRQRLTAAGYRPF